LKLRIAENFRAVFYAPFYAMRALGFAAREGLEVEWLSSDLPGGAIGEVKRGAIDAQWGGPMRVLKDHDSTPDSDARLVCFTEVVWRDPFYVIARERSLGLNDVAAMRLGVVTEVPTPWHCLRADLEDAGIDTTGMRKSGRLVENLTMPQQLEALAAGKLDAVQVFEPYASRALAEGNAILYAAAARGPTSYTTFITSRASASTHRDEFAALTRATQAMLDWLAREGPAELARVAAPFFADVPQELLRSGLERYHRAGLWSRTTAVSEAGFERLAYSLHAGGFIARRATYKECVHDFRSAA
jgi:NitT/TauT family transport system substrate-binding protein